MDNHGLSNDSPLFEATVHAAKAFARDCEYPIIPTDDVNIMEWKVQNCKYPFTYVVKDKDTLINLSNKFDISYNRIAKLNNIKNPNRLSKNQVLQLYSSGVYTIKEGDSLEAVSEMFNLSINKIMELNNISDLNLITVGQKIKLC